VPPPRSSATPAPSSPRPRRLACDASISRIITDGKSQILDVGRRTRTISPALRRALVVRDAGCVHPGCDRPPSWTEGHHLEHWVDGGTTDLANLILLCRRHHRAQHEGGRALQRKHDEQSQKPGRGWALDPSRSPTRWAAGCRTCRQPQPQHPHSPTGPPPPEQEVPF